jgi:hypothetical protein
MLAAGFRRLALAQGLLAQPAGAAVTLMTATTNSASPMPDRPDDDDDAVNAIAPRKPLGMNVTLAD